MNACNQGTTNVISVGDQAEIVFSLIGEPPFTFPYQRSEISMKKGVPGKVLETHTVSRVQNNEYSIFSALEGMLFLCNHSWRSPSHSFSKVPGR